MKKINYGQTMITIGFLCLLLFPLLAMNRQDSKLSEAENRYLAPFPQIFDAQGKLNLSIRSQMEDWVNDNIGFRDQFLKLYANVKYRIFHSSPTPSVEIGEDGWFFRTYDNNRKIAEGEYPLSLIDIANVQQRYKDYFASKNIEYLLFLPPSKISIYPEKLAGGEYTVIETPVDMIADYLAENTTVPTVSFKKALLEHKEINGPLYFKTDTHWNEKGAYVAYMSVIEQMTQMGLIQTEPVEVEFYPDVFRGEFSAMMGDKELLPLDQIKKSRIINPKAIQITEGDVIEILEKDHQQTQSTGYFHFVNPSSGGKKILIYGDSMFVDWNLPHLLAENFSELTYIWINQGRYPNQILPETVEAIQPDIVVLEIAERYTNWLALPLQEHFLR